MEFELVPQLVIVISASIIIFILGRNIPKAEDAFTGGFFVKSREEREVKKNFFYLYERLAKRINKEEYQRKVGLFWIWLEKILRKIRIGFLKFDGKITLVLDKLRKKNIASNKIEIEEKNKEKNEISVVENNYIEDKTEDNKAARNDINPGLDQATNPVPASPSPDPNPNSNINPKTDDGPNQDLQLEHNKKDEANTIKDEAKTNKEKECINLISKNPFDIKAYWNLGIIYSRRKNYMDAISCFRQIIKIDPTYAKAKKKIVDLMERTKGGRKAKKEIKSAKEKIKIAKKEIETLKNESGDVEAEKNIIDKQ